MLRPQQSSPSVELMAHVWDCTSTRVNFASQKIIPKQLPLINQCNWQCTYETNHLSRRYSPEVGRSGDDCDGFGCVSVDLRTVAELQRRQETSRNTEHHRYRRVTCPLELPPQQYETPAKLMAQLWFCKRVRSNRKSALAAATACALQRRDSGAV